MSWDSIWRDYERVSPYLLFKTRLHHAVVFSAYRQLLDPLGLEQPAALEIGCGTGELAARILRRYGGSATLLDSSPVALAVARRRLAGLPAQFVCADALTFRPKEKFDLVHSEGLIEHFAARQRTAIIAVHSRCAKKGGYVLISVPRPAWYYKMWRKLREVTGFWLWGPEQPMDAEQLEAMLAAAGLTPLATLEHARFAFCLARLAP